MTPVVTTDELVTAADLADRVGVTRANVKSWIRRGELVARGAARAKVGTILVNTYSLEAGKRLARLLFERKAK